jgi:glyceraldehyde-3-phosphate dehydrogenase/erythrose-4-phosphate dehydrogenase
MVKVLHDVSGVAHGFTTTAGAYAGDQMPLGGRHRDLRRVGDQMPRAAAPAAMRIRLVARTGTRRPCTD